MNEALLNPALIEAIQKAAQGVGIPALAAEMDMRPSSLYNCLNPWADRNSVKLGLEAALYIMRKSGDVSGLEIMAHEMGYALRKIDGTLPDKPTLEGECCDDFDRLSEFGKMVRLRGEYPQPSPRDVIRAAESAKDEIDQTARLWLEQRGAVHGEKLS